MPIDLNKPWVQRPTYQPGQEPRRFCHMPNRIELRPWHLVRLQKKQRHDKMIARSAVLAGLALIALAGWLLAS